MSNRLFVSHFHAQVRSNYARVAGNASNQSSVAEISAAFGYSKEDLEVIPEEANMVTSNSFFVF